MPLWLLALLFLFGLLLGLACIADYAVSRLSKALGESVYESLNEFLSATDSADDYPGKPYQPSLNDRLGELGQGIETLESHLEGVERLLLPRALLAASRFEKIGWDQFLQLRRKMDKAIDLSNQQKRQRKLMRDEHGMVVKVYEDEIEAALQKGWSLPDSTQ